MLTKTSSFDTPYVMAGIAVAAVQTVIVLLMAILDETRRNSPQCQGFCPPEGVAFGVVGKR